jgi:Domain of unknown function (DUF1995)
VETEEILIILPVLCTGYTLVPEFATVTMLIGQFRWKKIMILVEVAIFTLKASHGFVHLSFSFQKIRHFEATSLSLSSKYPENDGSQWDEIRKSLESSWNVESMGPVPTSPQLAAREAANAIEKARQDGEGSVSFVNLWVPQYDIQQGPRYYDEVEAVDFCRLLAECWKPGRSVIYVRDQKTVQLVSKIIHLRAEQSRLEDAGKKGGYKDNVDMEVEPDQEEKASETEPSSSVQVFDDFNDFAQGDPLFFSLEVPTVPNSRNMDKSDLPLSPRRSESLKDDTSVTKSKIERKRNKEVNSFNQPQYYRLASLFGDKIISSGLNMSKSVVAAIKAHGLPRADEETMIVLSANSDEEMLAIRALITKYSGSKTIVLVNCRLNTLPLELQDCRAVYHLTPLVATSGNPLSDPRNLFRPSSQPIEAKEGDDTAKEPPRPIKIVSLRRYPGDWQIYVDTDGNGFELARRAPAKTFNHKGPPVDYIVEAIKSFLAK